MLSTKRGADRRLLYCGEAATTTLAAAGTVKLENLRGKSPVEPRAPRGRQPSRPQGVKKIRRKADFLLVIIGGISFFRRLYSQAYEVFVACFGKHVAYVEADGASGDVEGVGDFLVGFVSAHEAEDVQFSSGEAGVVEAEGGSFFDVGKEAFAFEGAFHAVYEVGGAAFFVDKAVGSCFLGHFYEVDVGETGHDDDFLSGEGFFDASGDFDAAGAAFHADIHEDDVGLQNLGGHFCHFGELQDFHDFDFPRFFK